MKPLAKIKHYLASRTLRGKLTFIAVLITGLTLLASTAALISLEYYLSKQDTAKKLGILSEVIASHTILALSFNDVAMLQSNLATLEKDKSIVRGCIYTYSQRLIASYPPNQNLCPVSLPQIIMESTDSLHKLTPIRSGEQNIGALYIESNRDELNQRIREFLYYSAAILLTAILLSFSLSSWLQSVVIFPLKNLGTTLRNLMQKKDYSIRAEKSADDELGDLTDLFNNLLNTVERENISLKTSTARFKKLAW